MSKKLNKGTHKNKDALEFVLVNRGMDDPNYQNPNATAKVLLHVPKEEEVNPDHEKLLKQIPDINRGVYSDKTIEQSLKELGVESRKDEMNYKDLKKNLDELNKENFTKKVTLDLTKNEVVNFQKNSKVMVEEEIDTTFGVSKKNQISTDKKIGSKNADLLDDDKKIDLILKNAKISADIVEYNQYGLRKDIDPEVLNYITDKEFVEGVDIFIPAPEGTHIDGNRYDIDIPVEKMNEEQKELYEAMNLEEDKGDNDPNNPEKSPNNEEKEEDFTLEDNFVLLANEGIIPIELKKSDHEALKNIHLNTDTEMVIAETTDKKINPSYKFITKEEKEFLDQQFSKTMKEYDDKNDNKKNQYASKHMMEEAINELIGAKNKKITGGSKKTYLGLTATYKDEDEYEDYELDEEGDLDELIADEEEEFEDEEDEEEEKENDNQKKNVNSDIKKVNKKEGGIEGDEENKIEYFENNFKIQYEDRDKPETNKKPRTTRTKKKVDTETFTVNDLNELIKDNNFITQTIMLCENVPIDENEDLNGIPVYYPKKKLDITSQHGRITHHFPKTIGEPNKKISYYNKDMTLTQINNQSKMMRETRDKNEHSESQGGKTITLTINTTANKLILPDKEGHESKYEKKLRKKFVKEEKKEKRKQKKELKTAFQSEKTKLKKQIADTNQCIRYGLSVKEI